MVSSRPAARASGGRRHGGLFRYTFAQIGGRHQRARHGTNAAACGYFSAPGRPAMSLLKWALIFFIISIIAAIFGFGGISAAAADIARILFYIFLVIFIVLLVLGLVLARRV
jgi:uncharacterized membrane protein YtjA (UPF0391 family)